MPREFDDRQMDRDSVIPRPATTHDKQPHRLTGAHGPLGDGPAKKHSVAQSTAANALIGESPASPVPERTTADAVITLLLNVTAEFKRY